MVGSLFVSVQNLQPLQTAVSQDLVLVVWQILWVLVLDSELVLALETDSASECFLPWRARLLVCSNVQKVSGTSAQNPTFSHTPLASVLASE